ncbi:MAG: PA2779 family protein [Thiomonas sp.]|uniref:PA2779 family protein n=1 Tax=mine drainage metagenome TaxID=410659 RepID=E6PR54_9ZZZZ
MNAKRLSSQLVTTLFSLGLLAAAPAAKAELIGTQQLTQQAAGAQDATLTQDRQTLDNFMARADVQQKLEQMGLSQDITQQRLAALSNQEVASLAGKIDAMPAAGDLGFQELVIILLVAILVVLAI